MLQDDIKKKGNFTLCNMEHEANGVDCVEVVQMVQYLQINSPNFMFKKL